jgi:hypothetical protein
MMRKVVAGISCMWADASEGDERTLAISQAVISHLPSKFNQNGAALDMCFYSSLACLTCERAGTFRYTRSYTSMNQRSAYRYPHDCRFFFALKSCPRPSSGPATRQRRDHQTA